MKVMVVADGHYFKDLSGDIYVRSVFDHTFYKRYLMAFEEVLVVARVKNVSETPKNMQKVNGEGIKFLILPSYKGPWQYLKKYREIVRLANKYSKLCDCAIFRLPGATANIMCKKFLKTKKPFAIEIVVDPWEYFAKGTIKSVTRPFIRVIWTNFIKKISKKANGVSYVTKEHLQKKYPSKSILEKGTDDYFDSYYSSVEIDENSYGEPKKHIKKNSYLISHASNAFTGYGKGHITVMESLKEVLNRGYNVQVQFIGEGPLKETFINMSKRLGIEKNVKFLGRLANGDEVRKVIKESDLFVFPTRAEGLPRVLLEAMAEGLPCLSTPVSGIPEILSENYLCEYDDYNAFADKIIKFIKVPSVYENASEENIKISKEYSSTILNKRRKEFYLKLKKITKNR